MLNIVIFGSNIAPSATIGEGTRVGHRGLDVFINGEAVIGKNALIRAHVTIGKAESSGQAPVIGDGVEIGDGAKIMGNVKVGNNSRIGPNSVVLKDVPDNSMAMGVPAMILHQR